MAAVVATAHDILTTIAFLAMMHLEVSLTVVAALLTVIGYSLNDTIIIFDRVRENLKKQRKESLREVLNRSINETLPRSVLTHATVLAATIVAAHLRRRSHSSVLVDHGVRCLHRNVQLHLRGRSDPALDRAQVAALDRHPEQRARPARLPKDANASARPSGRSLNQSPTNRRHCAAVLFCLGCHLSD